MTKPLVLQLRLDYFKFNNLIDKAALGYDIFSVFFEDRLIPAESIIFSNGIKKKQPINIPGMKDQLAKTSGDIFIRSSSQKLKSQLVLDISKTICRVLFKIEINAAIPTLIDQLIFSAKKLFNQFSKISEIGPNIEISFPLEEYKKMYPPRFGPVWNLGAAVNFFHIPLYEKLGYEKELSLLKKRELPAGATKEIFNDFLIINWIDNLSELSLINRQRSVQEEWFVKTLHIPVDASYNDWGDRLVITNFFEKHTFLTFIDTFGEIGYKAVVIDDDHSIDDRTVEKLSHILSNKSVDGYSVQEVKLILPSREDGLLLLDWAKSNAISGIAYPDDQGELWEIIS